MIHIAHLQGRLHKRIFVRLPPLSPPAVLTLLIGTFRKTGEVAVGTATTTKTALSSVPPHLVDAA